MEGSATFGPQWLPHCDKCGKLDELFAPNLVILPPGKGSGTGIKAKETCNCVSPGDSVKMQTLIL